VFASTGHWTNGDWGRRGFLRAGGRFKTSGRAIVAARRRSRFSVGRFRNIGRKGFPLDQRKTRKMDWAAPPIELWRPQYRATLRKSFHVGAPNGGLRRCSRRPFGLRGLAEEGKRFRGVVGCGRAPL
jgi:hypothetical protein